MNASPQKRLRLTRFSLRGGLLAITVLAVWSGLHMQSVKRQRASVEALARHGFAVWYGFDDVDFLGPHSSMLETWLQDTLRRDHFVHVQGVHNATERRLDEAETEWVLSRLAAFSQLKELSLGKVMLNDRGARRLSTMDSLNSLELSAAVDADWLADRLPNCKIALSNR